MGWRLYKRDKIWWGTQTVRGNRERRSTRTGDRKAADAIAAQWDRADADPRHHAAYTTTLGVALTQLIADRRTRGRADGTLRMYDQKTAHLARVLGQDTVLADIGAAEVDAFLEMRVGEGAARNTISKELTALRGALRIARRRGQFNREVSEVMPIGWSSDYVPRKTFLTKDEVAALMMEIVRDMRGTKNPHPRPDRAAHVAFIVATGARWSESLRAERLDIDIDARRVILRGTKTDQSAATIAVSPAVVPLLQIALLCAPGDRVLFRKWPAVRRDMAMACKRAGIPSVTPNDLRRTAATWLVQAGVPIFAVSKVLRHADTRMVERVYGQLPTADLGRILDASVTVPAACPTEDETSDTRDQCDDFATETCAVSAVVVPRGGIEPSTRGFSIPSAAPHSRLVCRGDVNVGKDAVSWACPELGEPPADPPSPPLQRDYAFGAALRTGVALASSGAATAPDATHALLAELAELVDGGGQ